MVLRLSEQEMLFYGLAQAGIDRCSQQKQKHEENVKHFKALYGSEPRVYAALWEDLQTTLLEDAHIDPKKDTFDGFLIAIHFLKCYPTQYEQKTLFHYCIKTGAELCWKFCRKIQALKAEKVRTGKQEATSTYL